MKFLNILTCLAVITLSAQLQSTVASAQSVSMIADGDSTAREPENVTKLMLSPTQEPVPALKYRLLPSIDELRPGNSVVWYGKVEAEQTLFFNKWRSSPENTELLKLPIEQVKDSAEVKQFTPDGSIYRFLKNASLCETTDWQLPIRDGQVYAILLPEVQRNRSFSRLLALRARRQIAEGDYEGAIDTFKTNTSMSQQVAESHFYVCSLVGLACYNLMHDQMLTMVQQPDAPSLYWALSYLPNPLISMEPANDTEFNVLELSFPELANLESTEYGEEYWNRVLKKIVADLKMLTSYDEPRPEFEADAYPLLVAKAYPAAKKILADQGMSSEEIDAMPAAQAILRAEKYEFDIARSEAFRLTKLPAEEVQRFKERQTDAETEESESRCELDLAEIFIPAVDAVNTAQKRTQQNVATLRVIEALRLHAGQNGGALPMTLDEISIVPIPLDPLSNKPFVYELKGDHALLKPFAVRSAPQMDYEIRIRND